MITTPLTDQETLASYLQETLLDEAQKEVHDISCIKIIADPARPCDCQAGEEWRQTLGAIFHAVHRLRQLDHDAAMPILLDLAEPYRDGSGYPRLFSSGGSSAGRS